VLGSLLERLEKEKFSSSRTRGIFECLHAGGIAPSRKIRRLRFVVELLDSRRSQVFVWIAPFLLWTSQCAMAIEAWRIRWGPFLGPWLDSIGELEALLDLAGYAWEHPSDPFPEFVSPGPSFEAEQLGHPLLPEGDCVRNDVALGASRRLLIVTGSNMSGKSTLLRSIGINAVLAQAGAPVRAGRLRLSPLAIGACVRIVDSLQEGRSRFYAEITTLRGIVALTESARPVLFLLDELLHGTNSHDRERGGRAVVHGLLARGSIGLVTTHDLALAKIADDLAPQAANVHFADELRDGELHFDYELRSGVVEHSNALELMRAVGLEV